MKKTLLACLAVVAVLAVATPAFAITCTIDQRPAATLLVPYFQVSYDADGNLNPSGNDTIVTIANASAAPMIAHVNVFDRQSQLVLDFNIALTPFDVQAMRMSDILAGSLPDTVNGSGEDACQVNVNASVYPDPDGFLRVRPLVPATGQDNTQATTDYNAPFPGLGLPEALRTNCDGGLDDNAIGYIIIDHANYCNLSDPTDPNYYYNDAIGMENNLWGEIIFTSGTGIPTYAMSTVNIEADASIGDAALLDALPVRSFDARYWDPLDEFPPTGCPNCNQANPENDLLQRAPWDVGFGDQREPLGLRWAARWFDAGASLTTNFRVWRASTAFNGNCDVEEAIVTLRFYDEDENTTGQGRCPSPCTNPTFNFPLETQQRNIVDFARPTGAIAGWVQLDFLDLSGGGTILDQSWVDYSFEGALALETILVPGTQLDPSTCNPEGSAIQGLTEPVAPVIPSVAGTGVTS
ncbi:MAG TPA: hypothetical protein VGH97_15725 [Thermoanaerobaculia bacterium]|jgi:hypothetical protein